MSEKLALHIIARDENDQLKRIIERYGKYFDEIAIAYDDIKAIDGIEVSEKVGLYHYEFDEDEKRLGFPNFAKKRNFLADKTKSDYYLRLDTDDDILNPENILPLFHKMVMEQLDVILVPYLYAFDADGNCIAEHIRETLIRKSDNHAWNKSVHENILVKDLSKYRAIDTPMISIKHNMDMEHAYKSGERNLSILLDEFKKDKENTDPRTVAYIGRMFISYGRYDEAIYFLQNLISRSGWQDDKYYAWIDLANCYMVKEQIQTAIACCNEALAMNTEFPDAYNALGQIYVLKKDYQKAVDWLKVGLTKKSPRTHYVIDPSNYTIKSPMNLAIALLGIGEFEKAIQVYEGVYKLAPNTPYVKNYRKIFEDGYDLDKYFKTLGWMYFYTKEKQPEKLEALVNSIPDCMMQDERIVSLKHRTLPPKKWSDKSIVFYCGTTFEEWAAPSVITGVGGSEEAVIYLGQELTKLGYEVTVFNNCGSMAGTYAGVEYKQFFEFNPYDEYNQLVLWRLAGNCKALKAKKKILWMHDVPTNDTANCVDGIDKIIVLSEYHKSLLPKGISEDKIFVSSNGINLKDFNITGIERKPNRLIYTSSYDRGIEHLLQMWPAIRKEVPDAELHLFYGWNTFDKIRANDPRMMQYKEVMVRLMQQDGVFEHGRVGHKKLVKELMASKFWVYPCHFPEISCISAMKSQAAGCVPVCTNYAALAETVKDGVVINGKAGEGTVNANLKNRLIEALKTQPTVSVDKEQFGWDKVALTWRDKLFA